MRRLLILGLVAVLLGGVSALGQTIFRASCPITNVALTSNVATITCVNTLSAGAPVVISSLAASALNGYWRVASATPTSFTFNFTHADISSTADSGNADDGRIYWMNGYLASTVSGHPTRTCTTASGCELDFEATGSLIELQLDSGFGNVSVSCDGKAPSTIAVSGGYTYYTACSGADVPHLVRVRNGEHAVDAMIRVTGSAPALSVPTDSFGTYGRNYALYDTGNANTPFPFVANGGQLDPYWLSNLSFTHNLVNYLSGDVGIRFNATAGTSAIRLWANDTQPLVLFQDGIQAGTQTFNATPFGTTGTCSGIFGWYNFSITTDGNPHLYEILIGQSLGSSAHNAYCTGSNSNENIAYQVMIVGGTIGTPASARPCYLNFYGDSYTQDDQWSDPGNGQHTVSFGTGRALGCATERIGYDGKAVYVNYYLRDHTSVVNGIGPVSANIQEETAGSNDLKQPSVTQVQWQTAYGWNVPNTVQGTATGCAATFTASTHTISTTGCSPSTNLMTDGFTILYPSAGGYISFAASGLSSGNLGPFQIISFSTTTTTNDTVTVADPTSLIVNQTISSVAIDQSPSMLTRLAAGMVANAPCNSHRCTILAAGEYPCNDVGVPGCTSFPTHGRTIFIAWKQGALATWAANDPNSISNGGNIKEVFFDTTGWYYGGLTPSVGDCSSITFNATTKKAQVAGPCLQSTNLVSDGFTVGLPIIFRGTGLNPANVGPFTIASISTTTLTNDTFTLNDPGNVMVNNTATTSASAIYQFSDLMPDNGHISNRGFDKVTNFQIPLFCSYLTGCVPYSVSGPSSGTVAVASLPFTFTLNNTAQFTANSTSSATSTTPFDAITLLDGGAGGTFTSSLGSGNPVTVNPVAGSTSFTFTYTPASAGARTLTVTNGQGWKDVSPFPYTALTPGAQVTPGIQAAGSVFH